MKNNTLFNNIFIGVSSLLLSVAAVSCDDVAPDDRYLLIDPVVPGRVVLIEDFTGQNCVNCPDAHLVIEELQKQYGDAIVPVSIHGGAFSISRDDSDLDYGYVGLATPEGEEHNKMFNVSTWPQGLIDRRGGTLDYSSWASAVRTEIERPAEVTVNLDAALTGDKIEIDVELIPRKDVEGYLQVWVLESGIVARQRSSSGIISDYVHDNVFRAAVNGVEGDKVELSQGIHHNASFSIDVRNNDKERWQVENLSVVAFVRSSDGVMQTAIVNL